MNKRQRKKNKKKQFMFAVSFVSSYKGLKKINRSYHQFVISDKRKSAKDDSIIDKFNSIGCTSFSFATMSPEEIEFVFKKAANKSVF